MPTTTEKLEFKVTAPWAKFEEQNSWAAFIPETAKDASGQTFMRAKGRSVVYKVKSEDEKGSASYECAQCGNEILSATVAHPIHDGPFPLSGSGECHYEAVPYCPRCEKKPDFHGTPVTARPQF